MRSSVPGRYTIGGIEQAINVASGVTLRSANFALTELGSVAGMVYEDMDGSGRQEPGEPGVGGAIVPTTDSAPDGLYRFTGTTAGSYVLRIALGAPYVAVLVGDANCAGDVMRKFVFRRPRHIRAAVDLAGCDAAHLKIFSCIAAAERVGLRSGMSHQARRFPRNM